MLADIRLGPRLCRQVFERPHHRPQQHRARAIRPKLGAGRIMALSGDGKPVAAIFFDTEARLAPGVGDLQLLRDWSDWSNVRPQERNQPGQERSQENTSEHLPGPAARHDSPQPTRPMRPDRPGLHGLPLKKPANISRQIPRGVIPVNPALFEAPVHDRRHIPRKLFSMGTQRHWGFFAYQSGDLMQAFAMELIGQYTG